MRKSKKKSRRLKRNIIALISVLALFGFTIGVGVLLSRLVISNLVLVLSISGGILVSLLIFGWITWKRITNKIKDIFT
jgi:hypothetical protein